MMIDTASRNYYDSSLWHKQSEKMQENGLNGFVRLLEKAILE